MNPSHCSFFLIFEFQLTYYECHGGYCSEIYNLKCERRCDSKTFYTTGINSILFVGEKVIMANCEGSVFLYMITLYAICCDLDYNQS